MGRPTPMLNRAAVTTAATPERDPIRWNRALSKAFDVTAEQFPAASAEEALVSKYLGVEIKFLERRKTSVMAVRMGAFLSAVDNELRSWLVDDTRNLDWQGRETTPLYETIQLNSTKSQDFLVDGMRFLQREDSTGREMATFRVQPRWWGLEVTVYGLRATGTAHHLLGRVQADAKTINFLKGEAFSLSGEFLPKTGETFSDLFLDPSNAAAVERVVTLINTRGKALENRGVLLMGPPGTGKTLSARIVRNEAQATFIWVSSRDFHYSGSFGGFTEAFDLARECAPSVIVFEDVDNWLYDTTVDLLKSEMDGVAVRSGVVTMMTTNFPELLPAALIDRPGRFHDVLRFGLPDAGARKQMLQKWLPGLADTDLTKAVTATAGYSGAHVRELVRFATIIAEQDGLSLAKALAAALVKLAEQRELISDTQRQGSRYRMPAALAGKTAVRLERAKDFSEKADTLDRMYRAHADLHIKTVSESGRKFTGMATTPTPDRVGDVIDPLGVDFSNPMPLLLFHNGTMPVGEVVLGRPTADGIPFTASIPDVTEPGIVKDLTDQAAHLVKYKLTKAVSIGFRSFMDAMERIPDTGGWKFIKSEVMELSLVAIPANPDALIHAVKSLDGSRAVPGKAVPVVALNTPGVAGTPVVRLLPSRQEQAMKTIAEQITAFKSTRDQKFTELNALITKSGEAGQTPDANDAESCDTLEAEIAQLDKHITRLEAVEKLNKAKATPVVGTDPLAAHASRNGGGPAPVIHVRSTEEPGIGFTRAVICKALAAFHGGSALDFAKARYPDNDRVQTYLKASIPAGTTDGVTWAGPLVDPTNLASEFIEYLRPKTIIGKFGTGNIPSLSRVPFNVRITGQTSGGDAYWVGQGAPKPLTKFDFNAITLGIAKVAAISVITEELARLSTPSAETRVRDGLAKAVIARIDIDFIDPAQAAVAGVNPASITNGVTPLSPSGTTADAARADIAKLIKEFLDEDMDPATLVLIMPTSLALALSVQVNSLGQREFPDLSMQGGTFLGVPVITSQYAANRSGAGNLVIAVNAGDIFLADDGQVTVDASREASLQMLDNPTNSSATATATTMVSMFQTNSIALRAERFINWAKARATAVAYMDDVNWGSIGSPS
jgi:HK97 family phage major capsid protein